MHTCEGDFDYDVDGYNLSTLKNNIDIEIFALNYGRTDCSLSKTVTVMVNLLVTIR